MEIKHHCLAFQSHGVNSRVTAPILDKRGLNQGILLREP